MTVHRLPDVPKSDLPQIVEDLEFEGFTVTVIEQGNDLFTVEAHKDEAQGGTPTLSDDGGTDTPHTGGTTPDTGPSDGATATPTGDLLKRLVTIYKAATIKHPQLRPVTLAQWLLESGRAKSQLAKQHLNFGGLKFRPEMAAFATKVSFEAHDGVDDYCKFATI